MLNHHVPSLFSVTVTVHHLWLILPGSTSPSTPPQIFPVAELDFDFGEEELPSMRIVHLPEACKMVD
jgi:hypothetical protein